MSAGKARRMAAALGGSPQLLRLARNHSTELRPRPQGRISPGISYAEARQCQRPSPLLTKPVRLTSALRLRDMPASARPGRPGAGGQTGRLLFVALAWRSWQFHVPQQSVHDPVECLPGRLAVALVAHHQRIAGIELLIK